MANRVKLSQANNASRQKMRQKPTRVAMDDWQLHDLKKADAAVEVQKNARPVRHDPMSEEIRPPPKKGIDRAAPMVAAAVVGSV